MPNTRTCAGPCSKDLPETSFRPDRRTCRACESKAAGERRRKARNANPWSNLNDFDKDEEFLSEDWDGMIPFGLPIERACAESLLKYGSIVEAAEALQLEPRQLRAHLSELQRRAATRGWSPGCDMTRTVPEGFHVKGVSTYYRTNDDGSISVRGQWVKSKADEQAKLAMLLDAMSGIADAWKSKADPITKPTHEFDDELLAMYLVGDAHLGMHAWADECGDSFDLGMAEAELFTAVDRLVASAPPAKQALFISVGDFFHADNAMGTTTGGTRLDVDTRWSKVLRTGIRTMRRCIDRALEKHESVRVICALGNHDSHTSLMLGTCLSQFYEREPRVQVDLNPSKFHYHRFGQNLIGITHSDTVKLDKLPGVMACDMAKDWGETTYRRFICGHVHHDQVKEYPGCTVETIRTLAPKDAWHSAGGYRSGQDMKMDVIHLEDGHIDRHIIGIRQIKRLLAAR